MGPRTDPPKRLFLPLFRGQLSPPRPSDAEFIAGETATGPIFTPPRFPKCILQGGPYQSLWVRVAGAAVGAAGGSTSQQTGAEHHLEKSLAANLEQLLDSLPRIYRGLEDAQQFSDALQNHPSSPKQSGDEARRTDESSYAIYVALRQGEPAETALIPSLLSRGFRFHRFRDCNGEAQRFVVKEPLFAETDAELCYYRWEGPEQDRVPAFGSSNGGVGALILGPPPAADGGGGEPRTKVLLVFEYGWWKPVTGMVSRNESKFEALRRECTEEVGVEVETDEVYFVGGWQSCGAWDMEMNDEVGTRNPRISTVVPKILFSNINF